MPSLPDVAKNLLNKRKCGKWARRMISFPYKEIDTGVLKDDIFDC
jgi:hypothetical protein